MDYNKDCTVLHTDMDLFSVFRKKQKPSDIGSQRPLEFSVNTNDRNYDLEIGKSCSRAPKLARQLIEIQDGCYEAKESLRFAKLDVFASSDGDDSGFTISETTDDNKTAVNPEILEIADQVIRRKQSFDEYVIGGLKLQQGLESALMNGDSFLSLQIDLKQKEVVRSLYLPPWEIYRMEDDQGYLLGFEQRRSPTYLSNNNNAQDSRFFYAPQIVHIRNDRDRLYGVSLWTTSVNQGIWQQYKSSVKNIARAAKDLSINPTVYSLSESAWGTQQKQQFVDSVRKARNEDAIITDLFEMDGEAIRKLSQGSGGQLKELIDAHIQLRLKMIPGGFPVWRYPGLQSLGGAREISREPSRAYARMRYGWCQMLSSAIKQVIDTEIILKKGYDFYLREVVQGKGYRIIWSKWTIDGMEDDDESDVNNIEDLD